MQLYEASDFDSGSLFQSLSPGGSETSSSKGPGKRNIKELSYLCNRKLFQVRNPFIMQENEY